ncbi:cysteine hydrolase family protein [Bradyrhizobium sp.]|uniref:cysteine hydrolase family protein n=1 Tax=Bradyrhizobium sp. TaxID=376 RepID=UPI0039E6A043
MIRTLGSLDEQTDPRHAALLVVDLQNDFCAEGGYLNKARNYDVGFAEAVVARIERVVKAARAAGAPVVWIRSLYDFKYLSAPHIAKRREEGCCLEGTWGAEFYRLKPEPDDLIVTKHAFSGFRGTPLDDLLRAHGIKTLILTGVATNVCVDSTLRDGFFHGYYIVVLEDCVGSNNKVGHEGTLATVRTNIGSVIPSEQLISRLSSK